MRRNLIVWCRRTIGSARRTHPFIVHIIKQPCIAPFSNQHFLDACSPNSFVVEVDYDGGGTMITHSGRLNVDLCYDDKARVSVK